MSSLSPFAGGLKQYLGTVRSRLDPTAINFVSIFLRSIALTVTGEWVQMICMKLTYTRFVQDRLTAGPAAPSHYHMGFNQKIPQP